MSAELPTPRPREAWLTALERRADQPPISPRDALVLDDAIDAAGAIGSIGSIEPRLAERLFAAGLPLQRQASAWRVIGPADETLARIARWLHDNQLCSRWRGELLAVTSGQGVAVARIERAAARALGLTTQAVHLIGRTAGGGFWVQQRALDKATDPGLWDTLMGGLVAAGESIRDTLVRETSEEAGLAIEALQDLEAHGRITIRRPVEDGYMVEHIEVFEAVVPNGLEPANQDGEVERFACLDACTLTEWLRADSFTLEASLILARRVTCRV
ncbi:MAG: NUDIX domain-containing protein [Pseudomonadota bacterium]|nr:NUDIX domain-containing protein [Pseudomonadota bacterium]